MAFSVALGGTASGLTYVSRMEVGRGNENAGVGCSSSPFMGAPSSRLSLCSKKVRKGMRTEVHKNIYTRVNAEATLTVDSVSTASEVSSSRSPEDAKSPPRDGKRPLKVLVAGAGIGGLVFALAAKNKGIDVKVFERDLSAIRGEGQYRGPIQLQSNALAALEAVDPAVAEEIMANGCITGDRINGLVDGITGEWYIKFDTFTPAVERGLPVTRVISRMTLQRVLADAVGESIIENGTTVVGFEDDGTKVTAILEDGRRVEGDMLVGADGIRSRVRTQLLGKTDPTYSDYTCYTGICDFTPPDLKTVGYRVFLGNKQYFVSSDVGYGKMQWYAFYNEPAGGSDAPGKKQERLLQLFGNWCDGVQDLIVATPEDDIIRRDIYDRPPIFTWSKGRVTLLGDSAHAMQPNMGQGGCMAVEDGFQLALDLEKAINKAGSQPLDIPSVLQSYQDERRLRVGAVHGLARMAAVMASTYKSYLGEGMGPLSWITKLRIPHYGKVAGRFFIQIGMPVMLQWVLGGNSFALEGRSPSCRIGDKADSHLREWMEDDDALERAVEAEWVLVPAAERMPLGMADYAFIEMPHFCTERPTIIGSEFCDESEGEALVLDTPGVSHKHARVDYREGAFYLTNLEPQAGTWITRADGGRAKVGDSAVIRLHPADVLEFGSQLEGQFRIKLRKPLNREEAKERQLMKASSAAQ
eukprot:TRINITY_DN600_c0_g1_i1.p1 TRINITY_DN600_c0_g1~~TRINITY_DN600_c0_g1_i1.p1  ORF type:complete len:696 (-),score=179.34 TRINITY_DN600_c0_g1_i1:284-2371(-)